MGAQLDADPVFFKGSDHVKVTHTMGLQQNIDLPMQK